MKLYSLRFDDKSLKFVSIGNYWREILKLLNFYDDSNSVLSWRIILFKNAKWS